MERLCPAKGEGLANFQGVDEKILAHAANSVKPSCMEQETPAKESQRSHHDLGGASKFMCEAVDTEPHALTDFDKEVDALRQILGAKEVMSVDELRRCIEAIPEEEYHRLSYYRRWIRSITDNLLRKGVITEAELRSALDAQ